MKHRTIILLMAAMAAVGCDKGDTPSAYNPNTITFNDSTDNWGTKGMVYNPDNFTAMEVYAFYTAQAEWSAAGIDNISNFMFDQSVDKKTTEWKYSPLKYWPNNSGDKITFYALSPRDEIATTIDAVSGKPKFEYTSDHFAGQNNDLSAAVIYDKEKDAAGVNFEMQHALTRISISARVINGTTSDSDGDNIYYTVNGVMFYDIMSQGEMTLDASGDIQWSSQSTPYELSVTHGITLLDAKDSASAIPFDTDADTNLRTDYRDVCAEGQSIFVMPQAIEATTALTKPTVELRIRKCYTYLDLDGNEHIGELIFIPKKVEIPTPKGEGWKAGEWINLQFTCDAENPGELPLTVRSEVYDYTDVDLDITVNKNTYIYSDKEGVIDVAKTESTAEMKFFTNYDGNLTIPEHHIELDGTKTTSYGFVFYFDGKSDYIIPEPVGTNADGSEKYKIKLDDSYDFTYSVKQQTRGALGLYDDTDSGDTSGMGINKTEDDAVYTLTIDINEDHLTKYDVNGDEIKNTSTATPDYGILKGTIGVQQLSNAGGMITKMFPITLKKDL